jgi:hypothetical protein
VIIMAGRPEGQLCWSQLRTRFSARTRLHCRVIGVLQQLKRITARILLPDELLRAASLIKALKALSPAAMSRTSLLDGQVMMLDRRYSGSALVVVTAGCYPDLVLDDLVDKAVLVRYAA